MYSVITMMHTTELAWDKCGQNLEGLEGGVLKLLFGFACEHLKTSPLQLELVDNIDSILDWDTFRHPCRPAICWAVLRLTCTYHHLVLEHSLMKVAT